MGILIRARWDDRQAGRQVKAGQPDSVYYAMLMGPASNAKSAEFKGVVAGLTRSRYGWQENYLARSHRAAPPT
jgi:hypothetical protein